MKGKFHNTNIHSAFVHSLPEIPYLVNNILLFIVFGDIVRVVPKGVKCMDSITELIKNEIKRQYKSVRKFSEVSGIPYSTLSNALSKGVGGTSYDTVVKICKLLDIKQTIDSDIILFNSQFHDIYSKLSVLDEQGLHTVNTVLTMEAARCMKRDDASTVKPFNGIGFASRSDNSIDSEHIKSLIREVLEDG